MSIDEKILKQIADDLQRAFADAMFATLEKYMPKNTVQIPTDKLAGEWKPTFPDPLNGLLNVEDKGDYYYVKPTGFLGSNNFAEIAQIIKEYGGTYVSAGKNSHFTIPKKA